MSLDSASALALRTLLERSGYRTFHHGFGDGNVHHWKWRRFVDRLDDPLRTLVALFLLQRTIDLERAKQLLGDELLASLIAANVFQSDEAGVRTTGLSLISFRGFLFFFELVPKPRVYFNDDSITLGTCQHPAPNGLTLDLCSGTGIQAMIAAQHARHTDAVEIDERATAIAAINLKLNRFEERVTLFNEGLDDYVKRITEPLDLITFNPPQLPAPDGIDYSVGNGGPDGLAMTKRILSLYLPHLASSGSIEFIGCGLGRDGNPLFTEDLGTLLAEHDAYGHAQLIGLTELHRGDRTYECLVQTAVNDDISVERSYELFEKHFQALGVNEMYTFFMRVDKQPRAKRVTVANLAEVGKDWVA
ncbi:MAG TPA: methyltransferase [Thermoanaerobaculia bacterium]|nr:methyltransferase [Thermoanaerobaculia bacterium]